MNEEAAYKKTYSEVYLPNLAILLVSDYAQNIFAFKAFKGKNLWAKAGRKVLDLAVSGLFEAGEEMSQRLVSDVSLGVQSPWGEVFYEGAVGFGVGTAFGIGGTALRVAADRITGNISSEALAQASERLMTSLDEAKKAAEMSKVLARSPETFEDFVEHVTKGGQESVFVDSDFFRQVLGDEAIGTAQALGVFEQFAESENTGADLEVKVSKLLSFPEIYDKVKDDIKASREGMTRRQALEYQKNRTEEQKKAAEEGLKVLQIIKDGGVSASNIHQKIKDKYLSLGHEAVTEEDAEALSTFWTAWTLRESENWNMTPDAFYEMVNPLFFNEQGVDSAQSKGLDWLSAPPGKRMFASHTVSLKTLGKILQNDQFTGPSLAVTNEENPLVSGYGNVTFVAPSFLIDPQRDANTRVFATDAYTSRYPVNAKNAEEALASMREEKPTGIMRIFFLEELPEFRNMDEIRAARGNLNADRSATYSTIDEANGIAMELFRLMAAANGEEVTGMEGAFYDSVSGFITDALRNEKNLGTREAVEAAAEKANLKTTSEAVDSVVSFIDSVKSLHELFRSKTYARRRYRRIFGCRCPEQHTREH
jgi:hypothetical protein